jgi:hypothetical protein
MPTPVRTRTERWRLAATWFNQEIDNLLAENRETLGARMDMATQSLLINNVLAVHMREIALDSPLLEELCKVWVKAGISESLIIAAIDAFIREHLR